MEIIMTIAAFLVFMGYREWLVNRHIRDLEIKLIAKDAQEYFAYKSVEVPATPTKVVEDELIDAFDVDPQDALKGINK